MAPRKDIQIIEEAYQFPKRRRKGRRSGRSRLRPREDETPKRYPIIGCIDLRCSRDDYDQMEREAQRAGLDFDDWASAALVRAVRRPARRRKHSL